MHVPNATFFLQLFFKKEKKKNFIDIFRFGIKSLLLVSEFTAIFLTNGLFIVYHSLLQCLPVLHSGWGPEFSLGQPYCCT